MAERFKYTDTLEEKEVRRFGDEFIARGHTLQIGSGAAHMLTPASKAVPAAFEELVKT